MKRIREIQTVFTTRPCLCDSGETYARASQPLSPKISKQSGQVLVLTVIMMLVLGIATFILFNTGQLVTRKTQLANAADAAAYSAAVEEARVMNLMAYTNRARIANQVAIAQAVSLVSWMNFARKTAQNIRSAVKWLRLLDLLIVDAPIVEAGVEILNRIAAGLAKGVKKADKVVTGAAKQETKALDNVVRILSTSQNVLVGLLLKRGKGIAGQWELYSVADNVVHANDRDAHASYISSIASARPFQKWVTRYFHYYKLGPDQNRYKNVIMEARDGFTRRRDETHVFGALRKAGGTDLLKYNTWASVDTFAIHIGGKQLSIGWGSAQAGKKRSYLKGEVHGRGWKSPYDQKRHRPYGGSKKHNKKATKKAKRNSTVLTRHYKGLRRYYDIADTNQKHIDMKNKNYCHMSPSLAGPCITVEAKLVKDYLNTTNNIKNIAGGKTELEDVEAGDEMVAIASAQVYFYRPNDLDNFHRQDKFQPGSESYIEYGSLFSPYWQARLAPTPAATRAALIAAQGVGL